MGFVYQPKCVKNIFTKILLILAFRHSSIFIHMKQQDQCLSDYCRISLYINLELYSQIEELSNRLQTTKTDTIYHAILLYLKYNETREAIFDALDSEKQNEAKKLK